MAEEARDKYSLQRMTVLVDLSRSQEWDEPGSEGGRAGVLSEVDPTTQAPVVGEVGEAVWDPLNWALQVFPGRDLADGSPDRRMAAVSVNDFAGDDDIGDDDESPYGQRQGWTVLNRSTRERDLAGREALPSSQRAIVDADDGRWALALYAPGPDTGGAETVETGATGDALEGEPLPKGMEVVERLGRRGIAFGGSGGGLFVGGENAIAAARAAIAAGGSPADAARWAIASSRGQQLPALLDAPPGGGTRERATVPEPDRNPGGSSAWRLDRPGGYVWDGDAVGLLGSYWDPSLQLGSWSQGSEGTPIGPLVRRHDAQIGMEGGLVGRMLFDPFELQGIEEGAGKIFKGALGFDRSRANVDTELGLESGQWRPMIRVDAALPPSGPPPLSLGDTRKPPRNPPPGNPPPGNPPGGGPPPPGGGGGGPPPPGGGGGGPNPQPGKPRGGDTALPPGGGILVGGGVLPTEPFPFGTPPGGTGLDSGEGRHKNPCPPAPSGSTVAAPAGTTVGGTVPPGGGTGTGTRAPDPEPTDGTLPATSAPASQHRDLRAGNGAPCVNLTAGTPYQPNYGHPAIVEQPDGSLAIGGVQAQARRERAGAEAQGQALGKRRPGGGGGGASGIQLGIPGRKSGGIVVEEGGRAVPRGSAERAEKAAREAARERARAARKAKEDAEIKRLEERALRYEREAEKARDDGKPQRAEWRANKARLAQAKADRLRKRQEERLDREQRRREYYERKRQETRENLERYRQRSAAANARRLGDEPAESEGGHRIPVQRGPVGGAPISDEAGDAPVIGIRPAGAWGDWNAANLPAKHLGEIGGPTNLEDWAALMTEHVRSLQSTVVSVFGGPNYYAGNMAVLEENGPGKTNAGNVVGTRTHVPSGSAHEPCPPPPALNVVSHVDADAGTRVRLAGGGVQEVTRAVTGTGANSVEDLRPAILVRNNVGDATETKGDVIATDTGGYRVTAKEVVQAQGVQAVREKGSGDSSPLLLVGTVGQGLKGKNGASVAGSFAVLADGTVRFYDSSGNPVAVAVSGTQIVLTDKDGTQTTLGAGGGFTESDLDALGTTDGYVIAYDSGTGTWSAVDPNTLVTGTSAESLTVGGDGSDGPVTEGGGTTTRNATVNATTYVLGTGRTLTATTTPASVVRAQDSITAAGAFDMAGKGNNGGTTTSGTSGDGDTAGEGTAGNTTGALNAGGGGGGGGSGGGDSGGTGSAGRDGIDGGDRTAPMVGGASESVAGGTGSTSWVGGLNSGQSGGNATDMTGNSDAIIEAAADLLNGWLQFIGPGGAGGGGGAGGNGKDVSGAVGASGALSTAGGNGSSDGGGGGGGGGGRPGGTVALECPGDDWTLTGSTADVSGEDGGAGGNGEGATTNAGGGGGGGSGGGGAAGLFVTITTSSTAALTGRPAATVAGGNGGTPGSGGTAGSPYGNGGGGGNGGNGEDGCDVAASYI